MASSNKEFTHYNCNHNFGGSVAARGFISAGPMPADAADVTAQPPKVGEMRADATRVVLWDGSAWATTALGAWA